jgi:hypothetical protein
MVHLGVASVGEPFSSPGVTYCMEGAFAPSMGGALMTRFLVDTGIAAGLAALLLAACEGDTTEHSVSGPDATLGGTGGDVGVDAESSGGGDGVSTGTAELVSAEGWVGGEESDSVDDPLGIQGAFYTYGDGLQCCVSTSCEGQNPCSTGQCCWSGTTVLDGTYAAWGCGLGLELQASGGQDSVKSAYSGAATCFAISISGDSGGNKVRIGFTQLQDTTDKVSPFVEIPSISGTWSDTVCFDDVSCPTWSTADQCELTGEAFDLQIQIVGGEREGSFDLCVDSIVAS